MAKCTFFSLSVSFLKKYTKILTLFIVILCLSAGMLVDTPLTYAQTPTVVNTQIVVQFMSLGTAKSATALFGGQKQPSQCVTAGNSNITGSIAEKGVVSVEFFSSLDCSGTQNMPFFRFSALPVSMGGTVICQSNTNCLLSPKNPNSPILRANFMNLGTANSAALNFRGQLIGGCITQNNSVSSGANPLVNPGQMSPGKSSLATPTPNVEKVPNSIVEGAVDNNPVIFSITFFPTSDCSGGRKISSFRYSRILGSGEATLTIQSERKIYAPSGVLLIPLLLRRLLEPVLLALSPTAEVREQPTNRIFFSILSFNSEFASNFS